MNGVVWEEEVSEGAHQGAPGSWHAQVGCAHLVHLPLVLFAPKILKYLGKNCIKFSEHSENFYFEPFFIAREIQKIDKTWHFILFN